MAAVVCCWGLFVCQCLYCLVVSILYDYLCMFHPYLCLEFDVLRPGLWLVFVAARHAVVMPFVFLMNAITRQFGVCFRVTAATGLVRKVALCCMHVWKYDLCINSFTVKTLLPPSVQLMFSCCLGQATRRHHERLQCKQFEHTVIELCLSVVCSRHGWWLVVARVSPVDIVTCVLADCAAEWVGPAIT